MCVSVCVCVFVCVRVETGAVHEVCLLYMYEYICIFILYCAPVVDKRFRYLEICVYILYIFLCLYSYIVHMNR